MSRYLVESEAGIAVIEVADRPDHSERENAEQAALDAVKRGLYVRHRDEAFSVKVTPLLSGFKVNLRRPLELA